MPRGIPSDVINHFKAVPLFSAVSAKGIRAIVGAATEVDVRAGAALVREGEFGRELYVIIQGEAVVSQRMLRTSMNPMRHVKVIRNPRRAPRLVPSSR